MKNILLCAAIASLSLSVHAKEDAAKTAAPKEVWQVKATYSYLKNDKTMSKELTAMEFTVPGGECKTGIKRATMVGDMEVTGTQEVCIGINRDTGRRMARGWLMTSEIASDAFLIFGERNNVRALDYGNSFTIETSGDYVRTNVGPYEIEMKRVSPAASAAPKKVAAKGSMDGKKVAEARKLHDGKKAKTDKNVNPEESAFAPQMVR